MRVSKEVWIIPLSFRRRSLAEFFLRRRCPLPLFLNTNLPVPVVENLFFVPEWVFIFGIIFFLLFGDKAAGVLVVFHCRRFGLSLRRSFFVCVYRFLDLFLSLRDRSKHKPHVPSFHSWRHVDLAQTLTVLEHLVQNFPAPVKKRHLAAAEKYRDLDPETGKEKVFDCTHFKVVVVQVYLGSHLHFLYYLTLCLLFGVLVALLLLEPVLSVVQDPAYRRIGLSRDLHEVEIPLLGKGKRLGRRNNPYLDPLVVDQKNFLDPDLLVDARLFTVFSYNSSPP